jgi:hypothetical protein
MIQTQNSLLTIITAIEAYCKKNSIDHRFVGSVSFGGLLTKETTYTISLKKRLIQLRKHKPLTLLREDNTIRDIDMILFCTDKEKIQKLKSFLEQVKKHFGKQEAFPLISVEATIYPAFGKRKKLLQFVTALEVDEKDQLYLAFENVREKISWKSVESWQIVLEGGVTYTTRNPIADYYAYFFRSPSGIKPKDLDKIILLEKLKNAMIAEGEKYHIDYLSDEYFGNWKEFIENLQSTKTLSILAKKQVVKLYWQTIGTTIAHGKGLGKIFLSLSNQFTGVKQ